MKEIKFDSGENDLRAKIERLQRERDDAYAEVMEARAIVGLDPFSTHGQLLAELRRVFGHSTAAKISHDPEDAYDE